MEMSDPLSNKAAIKHGHHKIFLFLFFIRLLLNAYICSALLEAPYNMHLDKVAMKTRYWYQEGGCLNV